MYYLVIGSSTEPSLFHAGCRPSPQVGLRPALISDLLVRKAHQTLTSDLLVRKARPTLTSDLLVRKACPALTYDLLVKKAHPTLTSDHVVNYNHIRKAPHSHISWKELNPLTKIKWPTLTSDME